MFRTNSGHKCSAMHSIDPDDSRDIAQPREPCPRCYQHADCIPFTLKYGNTKRHHHWTCSSCGYLRYAGVVFDTHPGKMQLGFWYPETGACCTLWACHAYQTRPGAAPSGHEWFDTQGEARLLQEGKLWYVFDQTGQFPVCDLTNITIRPLRGR
jgi:hypothetical protein